MNQDFVQAVDAFPWTSEEQKEGFLALVQYLRQFGKEPASPYLGLEACFLIQKNHEAAQYWQQTFADQVSILRQEIAATSDNVNQLTREIDLLKETIRAQSQTIDALLHKKHT